ncbi:hypothetical protein PoB_004447700 [Plakobranchus ocellatus]|uniref:HTH CENPB-type domain-containing protein n=1 Tax=Plakobranchus ocellatus TaxID=259542 RepID=A0AAV4BG84_9GAST|nr:hypothetical protein PoB_004447700 [Plakobranchus ocellatus]
MAMKQKNLNIEMKLKLLADVDKKLLLKKKIAAKYDIPHNTLSIIMKNREHPKPDFKNLPPECKRQRQCGRADVDSALFKWCKQAQSINAPVSGPIMQPQAELIAAELGEVDFKASSEWLDCFKYRHDIVYKTACAEAASVDQTVCFYLADHCSEWTLQHWRTIPLKTFPADKTGLFFRCLPDKTYTFKGKKCSGDKQAKDRLTAGLHVWSF